MDDVTWGALTATLMVVGGIYTWFAFRRRGLAAALRGAALTLLPLAAYLTNTLEMLGRIGDAVLDWATSLVFSPVVWSGVVVAAIAGVLFVVSGLLSSRGLGAAPRPRETGLATTLPAAPRKGAPVLGGDPGNPDNMAEIEALLRKRGIS